MSVGEDGDVAGAVVDETDVDAVVGSSDVVVGEPGSEVQLVRRRAMRRTRYFTCGRVPMKPRFVALGGVA
jgi:hypothetical protein